MLKMINIILNNLYFPTDAAKNKFILEIVKLPSYALPIPVKQGRVGDQSLGGTLRRGSLTLLCAQLVAAVMLLRTLVALPS